MQKGHGRNEMRPLSVPCSTPSHPGIAAHLHDCPPCADELDGLLAAIAEPADD
jgi:hypothetical protein